MKLLAATMLFALLMAGCGGGGASLDSPKAIAGQLGCSSSFATDTTDEVGVEKVGTCQVSGQTVRLLTFANNDARDTFEKIARNFGSRYVKGDKLLVEVKGAKAESAVEDKL